MLSEWEKRLNKKPLTVGGKQMNLSNIFSDLNKEHEKFELNEDYHTIRYIDYSEYHSDIYKYVEPDFHIATENSDAKFILFSAPGAVGKSALAKHICYTFDGLYWELPDNKVAEYSFQGAIMEAVGCDKVSAFIESLRTARNFLVIDAFDEAEAGSGRTGIEFFLRDMNNVTKDCVGTCATLLARTESAIFIKKYFEEYNIPFVHYEIGYFAEHNAKNYIRNSLEKLKIQRNATVDSCIEAQFTEIKRILLGQDPKPFLGYAPVLRALAESYDIEKNTLNLLKNTSNSKSNCHLLKGILDDLLERERKKFLKAISIKLPKIQEWSPNVYNAEEQILRIFGKIAFADETLLVDIDESIPAESRDEYLEVVHTQLPQHPFIKDIGKGDNAYYDFTGIAFRDFVIAFNLAKEGPDDFVREYIKECKKYCPSQLLIGFFGIFSENKMYGVDIPYMYDSFKAHAHLGDTIVTYINGDSEECSAEFRLERPEPCEVLQEFSIIDFEKGIHLNQLSNCYIDVDTDVYIGNSTDESRIYNSVINCRKIIWRSERVSIEAYTPGDCVLIADSMECTSHILPRFEIKTDNKKNFKVSCASMSGYFKLMPYQDENVNSDNVDTFTSFANIIRRIFSCLRAHGKDAPARKMDFINNRIIGKSPYKCQVLKFLLDLGVLYTDEQDWLYKLNTTKIADFSINWEEVRKGDLSSLEALYKQCNSDEKSLMNLSAF